MRKEARTEVKETRMTKITEFKFIPTTETSTPFAAAADKCDFDKIGYIEDEYFQTGTADVYEENEEHQGLQHQHHCRSAGNTLAALEAVVQGEGVTENAENTRKIATLIAHQ